MPHKTLCAAYITLIDKRNKPSYTQKNSLGEHIMICRDITQIKELSELKLMAGKAGLSRNVRWLYFVDSCVRDIKTLGNWVSGGELFVCANEKILEDKEYIISMIKSANSLNAAGVILNVGSIEPEYIELANEFNLPLFEVPWTLRLVDLSQIICTQLIKEQNEENSAERLLSSIVFTHFDSDEDIVFNCKYYGFDLTRKNRIAIFKVFYDKNAFKNNEEDEKTRMRNHFQRCIKNAFMDAGVKKIMSMFRHNTLTVLFSDEAFSTESFKNMVQKIEVSWKFSYPNIPFKVGIGNIGSGTVGVKKSYSEAEKSLKLVNIISDQQTIFFDSIGIYALLFNIQDLFTFEMFYKRELGKLIEYDKLNNTQLCETLEVYLEKDKVTSATAEALFIHRNTLRYRLQKIRTLLDKDLDKTTNYVNIVLAFKIKKYTDTFFGKATQ
jgi:Regulator of polyketide synthase expression